jgi:hypothetical protein
VTTTLDPGEEVLVLAGDELALCRRAMAKRDDLALKLGSAWAEFRRVETTFLLALERSRREEALLVEEMIRRHGHDPAAGNYHLDYATGQMRRY